MLVSSACSDNEDIALKPTSAERTLDVSAHGQTTSDKTGATAINIDLNAGFKSIEVAVACNTLWKVEVKGTSGWCSVNVVRGQGNGSFTISVLDNMGDLRFCEVYVYQIDGNGEEYDMGNKATIKIKQEGSKVRITPSSVDIFAAQNPSSQEFMVVANVEWTLTVAYETEASVHFLTIEPGEGMTETEGADGEKKYSGSGNASFRVTLQNNGTALVRKASLDLVSGGGNYSVEISQQKSEYIFDVAPNDTRFVRAEGYTETFRVLSSAYGWTVSAEGFPWISCPNEVFEKSDSRIPIQVQIAPNDNGRERIGTITFKSENKGYSDVVVNVVQAGYDLNFSASLSSGDAIVMEDGGSQRYSLDSRFDWIVSAPDWITASPESGSRSESRQNVTINIQANGTNANRTDSVMIIPQITNFPGGIALDPKKLGIYPIRLSITQFGGREPAISVPWLLDDYTQTSATVEFNFYSPFYTIVEAGLEWSKEDGSGEGKMKVTPSDKTEGTVSFELINLDPATRYVARGYVKDDAGIVKYSKWSYPFTTAGRFPGGGDNPTPSL